MTVLEGRSKLIAKMGVWPRERLWRERGDTWSVFEEIADCLNTDPPQPLPSWVLEYLKGGSNGVLASGGDPKKIREALGLGSQGQLNIAARHNRELENLGIAVSIPEQVMKQRNIPRERALRSIKKHARFF